MKFKKIFIPLLSIIALASCSTTSGYKSQHFSFDTFVDIRIYEGEEEKAKKQVGGIIDYLNIYDRLSNNYKEYENNIYHINQTNEEVVVAHDLYELLKTSFSLNAQETAYFNPLCGSLSKKWKEALADKKILAEEEINIELEKMNSTDIVFKDNDVIQRIGQAEIDLGAIAKGYVLDKINDYLGSNNVKKYLVNAGGSSILLGEKNTDDGLFSVSIKELNNQKYLKLKNCFVSTSGNMEQGVKIDGIIYSHIVNPKTGSVIHENDSVIVISKSGYLGDVLSTSLMMNTIDEIKIIENSLNVKTIVIKNGSIVYHNSEIEIFSH